MRPASESLFPRALLRPVVLAWLVICLLLLATNGAGIAALRFPDPDDTLRLVQVRDLIGGQGWFDLHQHRVDPLDGGVPMHWSRLVDVPIVAVILLTRAFLGHAGAEMAALIAVPLLTMLCLLVLAGRVARAKLGGEAVVLTCLLIAMAVPVIAQIRPLRIDHHGWQIVAAMAALNGFMARDPRRGGWATGAALAVGLAISLEGLPLMLVFAALGARAWLGQRDRGVWLAAMLQSLALTSLAAFLATRGLSDLAEHCDAISPVHLAIFVLGAVGVSALAFAKRPPLAVLLTGFAVIGVAALLLVYKMAPQCTAGSFNELDPVVRHLWYDQVAEGLPVWQQDWPTALQVVIPGLGGLIAACLLSRTGDRQQRRWWQEYALLLAGALAIACLVTRASGVSSAFAAIPLAWALSAALRHARAGTPPAQRIAALAGVVLVLMPSLPLTIYGLIAPSRATSQTPAAGSQRVSTCNLRGAVRALAGTAVSGNILAPLDIGPELLLATPDTVLATGHHRGAKAMREVIDAFTGLDAQAHAIVRRRRIDYVVLCPDLGEPALYAHTAPGGLAAHLLAGHAPTWLRPVTRLGDGLQIWRVIG